MFLQTLQTFRSKTSLNFRIHLVDSENVTYMSHIRVYWCYDVFDWQSRYVSWSFRWLLAPPRRLLAAAGLWGGASAIRSDPRWRQLWAGWRWWTGLWSSQTTPPQHSPWFHDVQVNSAQCPPVCLPACWPVWPLTSVCAGLTWTWWRWSFSATCSGSFSPSSLSPGPPGEWVEPQVTE